MQGSGSCLIWSSIPALALLAEENHEKFSQDNWYPGRDLKPEPPEYETGVLITRSQRSVG